MASFSSPARTRGLLIGLIAAMGLTALAGTSVGQVGVPLGDVWRVVAHHAFGSAASTDPIVDQIVWGLRVPRALLALIVGAGLAVAGTVIQAMVRNPLGDPYLLGIVPGASLGAVVVIVTGLGGGLLSLSGAAFAGAVVAFVATVVLSRRHAHSTSVLVLAGVAVGYLFSAATFFLQVRATPHQVQRILFWSLGSVANARWRDLGVPTLAVLIATAWLLLNARRLNALAAGDDLAATVGIDVRRFRLQLLGVTSLLTGVVVAVAGGVGFVGLMVPHVARLLVGADHRRVLPVAALLGAAFLGGVDLVARTALPPTDLPLGVVTAAFGAPFVLWLLNRREGAPA